MEKKTVWPYLMVALFIVCVLFGFLLIRYRNTANTAIDANTRTQQLIAGSHPEPDYKTKYTDLKQRYIELAKQHVYDLETLMKNEKDMRQYWTDYKDTPKDQFDEKVRRKIVRLQMEIENLEKEK